MDDKEQKQRERAYQIWEDEGRVDGNDFDHWQRAEEQHGATEKEVAAEVTGNNKNASGSFGDKPAPAAAHRSDRPQLRSFG